MRVRGTELWLVGTLFLGPLLLAIALYYGPWDPHALPRVQAEGRELFDPPLALPPLDVERDGETAPAAYRWSLIYATMAPCDARCTHELARVRAVHIALGRRQDRVRRVLLAPSDGAGAANDPELWRGRLDGGGELARLLGTARLRDGAVLVADPLGNVVLAYPAGAAQKDLLEDLKRLLDVSRIG